MGGDFAPAAAVEGAALAAAEYGLEISVVGQQESLPLNLLGGPSTGAMIGFTGQRTWWG